MHQRRMARVEILNAAEFHFQSPVLRDGFHLEADFVHVRDDENARRFFRRRPRTLDQIACIVRFRFCPFRQQRLHALANWIFVCAAAVSPD